MKQPSLQPQNIQKGAWYYESPRSIEVYVDTSEFPLITSQVLHFRIPAHHLERSLGRMNRHKRAK